MKTWHELMSNNGIDSYSNYMGDTSIKDMLVFLSRSRDSDTLTESNFETALERLGGESDTIQIHRFNHWASGWFELILINPTDTQAVSEAELMLGELDSYPVLDDGDYSEREYNKVMDYWKSCSLREKMYLCRDCGISFLSARHPNLPLENDRLYQMLAG